MVPAKLIRGEKYVNDHNNPVVKTEVFGSKLFLSSFKQEEEELKNKCLLGIESILKHDRVDRRNARSNAEWLPEENKAKVTKMTGSSILGFGVQNKNGKFLNNEEILFLLENNKLELHQKQIPMSILEAYKKIELDHKKYYVYKKLLLQGYKLKIPTENRDIKHKLDSSTDEPVAKVPKVESPDNTATIFEKLRQNGPGTYRSGSQCLQPNYHMSLNAERKEKFRLFIDCSENFSSVGTDDKKTDIYAFCSGDNVSFYRFFNTNIPVI